jgi:hypothetical protein
MTKTSEMISEVFLRGYRWAGYPLKNAGDTFPLKRRISGQGARKAAKSSLF